jgi:hypothetical protein
MHVFLLLIILCFLASPAWCEPEPEIDVVITAYQHRDYPAALAGFRQLAMNGDSRAQTILALMYRFGEGTPVDLPRAVDWYRRAATAGYAPAQYHLANMLAAGIGTVTDNDAAIRWWQAAAQGGFSRANQKLAKVGLSADTKLPAADRSSSNLALGSGLAGASAEIRDIIEWNLRLPNDWRLSPIDTRDDDQVIDHLPQMVRRDYRIQLGIFDSRPRAVAFWQRLISENSGLLINLQPFIETAEYLEQVSKQQPITTHRIQAGTFSSFSAAKAMCMALLTARVESGCLPVTVGADG